MRLAIAGFLVLGAAALWLGRPLRLLYGGPSMGWGAPSALAIGLIQALALLHVISLGATSARGSRWVLDRESVCALQLPAGYADHPGSGLYGSRKLLEASHTGVEWLAIGVGFAAAAISGALAIGFLLSWLRRRSVAIFSLYRLGFAALIVALVIAGR